MIVKNLNGTTGHQCKCGSWLAHWERFSGLKAVYCSVVSCYNFAEVGGHVQKDLPFDDSWYIVPLCHKCNVQFGQQLEIGQTALVPANKSITCERR